MEVQWNVYESFQALLQAGPYHLALEGVLILWIIWLLAAKNPKAEKAAKLSKKEQDDLIADWTPEPLVNSPPLPCHPMLSPRTVEGKVGKHIMTDGKKLLNMASHNYLNLSSRPEIEKASLECLSQYGVGSCGPRGFYGTAAVHLEVEEKLAQFFGCEKGILYSYGFSTMASAIPSYSKRGDVIFADEAVNFAIQRGIQASRSDVRYFRHNDMSHLEELLQEQLKKDKKDPKKAAATRRFLVVEGVYMNTGQICPLPELVQLREKHKLRLFIDESCSFGTLGPNAKGVTDYFNVPMKEVDLLMASLEMAAATTGGFCVGTKFVIEHQRLAGLGYCFSASLPPMLAAAGIKVLEILENEGNQLVESLHERCKFLHKAFCDVSDKMVLVGEPITPVKHLRLKDRMQCRTEEENLLRRVVEKMSDEGVALVMAAYLSDKETFLIRPSIRIAVNLEFTDQEVLSAAASLKRVLANVFESEE